MPSLSSVQHGSAASLAACACTFSVACRRPRLVLRGRGVCHIHGLALADGGQRRRRCCPRSLLLLAPRYGPRAAAGVILALLALRLRASLGSLRLLGFRCPSHGDSRWVEVRRQVSRKGDCRGGGAQAQRSVGAGQVSRNLQGADRGGTWQAGEGQQAIYACTQGPNLQAAVCSTKRAALRRAPA